MKSVLISIRPEWCELIVSGEKTLEVRKTRPKMEMPFKCYIYRTKGKVKHILNGKWFNMPAGGHVIGEFICDTFVIDKTFGHDALFNGAACMTEIECAVYSCQSPLYGWHISDLKIYDIPKTLSEFRRPCDNDLYCERCGVYRSVTDTCGNSALHTTRAPQSWCYVEEI